MRFYILASLIIFSATIYHAIRRNNEIVAKQEQNFWDRENRANSTRKKSLDSLAYIKIPLDKLPIGILSENPVISECVETLTQLSTQKIVNLTGYSNTDLKLEYGTANITPLSEYDQNYTVLVRTLQIWAEELIANGFPKEACGILEFAVETGSDISKSYYALADYYKELQETEKIQYLLEKAQNLSSLSKKAIVRTLQESYL